MVAKFELANNLQVAKSSIDRNLDRFVINVSIAHDFPNVDIG
jgi:hypothetical protein